MSRFSCVREFYAILHFCFAATCFFIRRKFARFCTSLSHPPSVHWLIEKHTWLILSTIIYTYLNVSPAICVHLNDFYNSSSMFPILCVWTWNLMAVALSLVVWIHKWMFSAKKTSAKWQEITRNCFLVEILRNWDRIKCYQQVAEHFLVKFIEFIPQNPLNKSEFNDISTLLFFYDSRSNVQKSELAPIIDLQLNLIMDWTKIPTFWYNLDVYLAKSSHPEGVNYNLTKNGSPNHRPNAFVVT